MATPLKQQIADNIDEYLDKHAKKELLRFVTIGSVDDGKSTLIGRLLHDTDAVYDDQLAQAKKSTKMGVDAEIDFSLITDGLKAEREQGITIDVAYRYFTTEKRKFIIADTPGHEQYTRNMATGASTAHVAIILIDARLGILPQSRRHAYIASLLGIPHLAVCINKMDLVDYDKDRFTDILKNFDAFTKGLGFSSVTYFPISALKGDNIVSVSERMNWSNGQTLLSFLETVPLRYELNARSFCLPVQIVSRPHLNFRGFAGTVISGSVKKGDEVMALPSGKKSRVASIVTYDGELDEAHASQAVTVTLRDEIDLSRGDALVHPEHDFSVARSFEAMMVWMDESPMKVGHPYWIKHMTSTGIATVKEVQNYVDVNTLEAKKTEALKLNDIGRVSISVNRPLVMDAYRDNRTAGAFILIDRLTNATVACGMIEQAHADTQGGVGRRVLISFCEGSASDMDAFKSQLPAHSFIDVDGDTASTDEIRKAIEKLMNDKGWKSPP